MIINGFKNAKQQKHSYFRVQQYDSILIILLGLEDVKCNIMSFECQYVLAYHSGVIICGKTCITIEFTITDKRSLNPAIAV